MMADMTEDAVISKASSDETLPNILAFEMQVGGHHPSYIRNIARLWVKRQISAKIGFLVTPPFFQNHAEVVEEVKRLWPERIEIDSISKKEHERIESAGFRREFAGWKTFCEHARLRQADHGILMYSDHFQLPMLLGQSSPCPFSCVYFRPTFHYSQWPEHRSDFKQWIAALRKKLLLKQVLKVKQLRYLFCLDEFVPEYIERNFKTHVKPLVLPDSFVRHETNSVHVENLRRELGVESGRTVLLLLGIMDSRKGPVELLDAALNLPPSSQERLCLLLIGQIDPSIEETVNDKIRQLIEMGRAQVVVRNEYIPDTFVQHYYELADVALTTYQQHKGMSSALMRAGLAKVPVLSSSFGLMGELVRRHQLGITVDTSNTISFSNGLDRAIVGEATANFSPEKAIAFANQHSPESLGDTLADWFGRVSCSILCQQ